MADFINTIDVLGDEAVVDSIIDRSITEFKDDTVTKVGAYAFYKCTALTSINLTKCTEIGTDAFNNCSALAFVDLPNCTIMTAHPFSQCKALEKVHLPALKEIPTQGFQNASGKIIDTSKLTYIGNYAIHQGWFDHLLLRNNTICSLHSSTSGINAVGRVYVPAALVDTYKAATNWSAYSTKFRPLEDYTADGTTAGDFVCSNVKYQLLNVTSSHADSMTGRSYQTTLSTSTENAIGRVVILMGGTDITHDVYDLNTNSIVIPNVTDDLDVLACDAVPSSTTLLYNFGDECASITGGWIQHSDTYGTEHVFEKGLAYMHSATDVDPSTGGTVKNSRTGLCSENKIAFKAGQTLKICCDLFLNKYNSGLYIQAVDATGTSHGLTPVSSDTNVKGTILEYTFDEDMTASLRFITSRWAKLGGASIKIYRITLE